MFFKKIIRFKGRRSRTKSTQYLHASGLHVRQRKDFVLFLFGCVFLPGACCSAQCGRSGCSLCASSTRATTRSRKSQRWCTPFSVSCFIMPSSTSGAAGASGWTPCPSPTPRSGHSLYPCTRHTHTYTQVSPRFVYLLSCILIICFI